MGAVTAGEAAVGNIAGFVAGWRFSARSTFCRPRRPARCLARSACRTGGFLVIVLDGLERAGLSSAEQFQQRVSGGGTGSTCRAGGPGIALAGVETHGTIWKNGLERTT